MSKKSAGKDMLIALAFCLPFFVLYTVFTIWPVIQGVYVSLNKWGLMGRQEFTGLSNYIRLAEDKMFWKSLQNTCVFVIISVPLIVLLALVCALFANRAVKVRRVLRVCYYLPSILSVAVASLVAKFVFAPYRGLLNGVLRSFGLLDATTELQWLQDPVLVWITLSVMTAWWTVGFSMLLYLSALQDISPQIMESAEIDGATKTRQLFSITLPLLKPTTFLVTLLQIISGFKVFGQIYLITEGGPASSTRPIIQYVYESAFKKNNLGYGASVSYVLFFILVVLSLVQQVIQKRGEKQL